MSGFEKSRKCNRFCGNLYLCMYFLRIFIFSTDTQEVYNNQRSSTHELVDFINKQFSQS